MLPPERWPARTLVVDAVFVLALAAYNLIRLPKLLAAPA